MSAGLLLLTLAAITQAQLIPPEKKERASVGPPQVGEKAPEFTLPDRYGAPVSLIELISPTIRKQAGDPEGQWVLLVFYRGYWCPICNADLRNFQQNLAEFTDRGVQIVAISSDQAATTRRHADKQGYTLTFLSDTRADVIRRYNLLREGEGLRPDQVARPAQFLIDPERIVRWSNLPDEHAPLASERILEVLDSLGRTTTGTNP
jgi:peroxiredoxin